MAETWSAAIKFFFFFFYGSYFLTLTSQCFLMLVFIPVSAALPVQQQCMRENKEKQALGDLMIKPVQRIPRYELLVKVSDQRSFSASASRNPFFFTYLTCLFCRTCSSTLQRTTRTTRTCWTPRGTSSDWPRRSTRAVVQPRRRRGRPGSSRRLRHTSKELNMWDGCD